MFKLRDEDDETVEKFKLQKNHEIQDIKLFYDQIEGDLSEMIVFDWNPQSVVYQTLLVPQKV